MRILIVDPEYLVAMEAERILREAFLCDTQIVMPRDFVEALRSSRYDVLLLDDGLTLQPDTRARLNLADTLVVFSSLGREDAEGLPDWPGVVVVAKPFQEERLLEAVKNAVRA